MDVLSRDQQRRAVEELAKPSGEGQVRVALKAIESARQAAAAGSAADRAAHVGYHLIDRGRVDLEAELAYRPGLRTRARRVLLRHAGALYLGAIAGATGWLVAAAGSYAASEGAGPAGRVLGGLLGLLPARRLAGARGQRGGVFPRRPTPAP